MQQYSIFNKYSNMAYLYLYDTLRIFLKLTINLNHRLGNVPEMPFQ